MTFRAIAVVPENAPVFKRELDLIIDYPNINKDYLVAGYGPPVDYDFFTKEEFHRKWKFFLGHEIKGQFTVVRAREET
jgi:hypothetical protein